MDEDEVPDYRDFIKKPMDFETMYRKLDKGEYKKVADLKADFILTMDNCALFNQKNTEFFTYGHRIRRIGLGVIKAAEKEEAFMNSVKL